MNILVQRCDDSSAEYSVCGVLDFGDCIVSCHVFELAIMMAYSMCSKPEDPVQNVIPLLAGYLDAFPLPETDLDCLFWGVLGRLAQSCTNGIIPYTIRYHKLVSCVRSKNQIIRNNSKNARYEFFTITLRFNLFSYMKNWQIPVKIEAYCACKNCRHLDF